MKRGAVKLKLALYAAGYTQVQAAQLLGVGNQWISEIVRGNKMPGDKLKVRMQELFNIDPSEWYKEGN